MTALYDTLGKGYAKHRRPDPRIAKAITDALGDARSIVNVGGGTGSYEPKDRAVVAVEPSGLMIAQRPAGAAPVVCGVAEALPFADQSFDAATAFLTTHHWKDAEKGLREMRRVARRRCVFFDHAFEMARRFWMVTDYFPDMPAPAVSLLPLDIARAVFGDLKIVTLPVPHDCSDGFFCAYWRRPEAYLDPAVRAAISFFANAPGVDEAMAQLKRDLDDGTWERRNGHLRRETEMDFGYRLVIAEMR